MEPLLPDSPLFVAHPGSAPPRPLWSKLVLHVKRMLRILPTLLLSRTVLAAAATLWIIACILFLWKPDWVAEFLDSLDTSEGVAVSKGVPMPFQDVGDGEVAWGSSILKAKQPFGNTGFLRFDFSLPRRNYVLPLSLGQTITVSCEDSSGRTTEADFYPFNSTVAGEFSLLVPPSQHVTYDDDDVVWSEKGIETNELKASHVVRMLQHERSVGDKIGIRPGPVKLQYQGQYLPVTNMLYVAAGTGIVPVLDQVQSIFEDAEKSLSRFNGISVVWINENVDQFDGCLDILEQLYEKHKSRLSVTCVVEDLSLHFFADSSEIQAAIPNFRGGTMAVLSAPAAVTRQVNTFLRTRGFPQDTICIL
jgi:hypothetical protein